MSTQFKYQIFVYVLQKLSYIYYNDLYIYMYIYIQISLYEKKKKNGPAVPKFWTKRVDGMQIR